MSGRLDSNEIRHVITDDLYPLGKLLAERMTDRIADLMEESLKADLTIDVDSEDWTLYLKPALLAQFFWHLRSFAQVKEYDATTIYENNLRRLIQNEAGAGATR